MEELIFSYTRRQALQDGVLIDVSPLAREAGIRYPTAVTDTVWQGYIEVPPGVPGQDEQGRLWDIVFMLSSTIARQRVDCSELLFELLVQNEATGPPQRVTLKAIVGPGDDRAPVITIMLPDED